MLYSLISLEYVHLKILSPNCLMRHRYIFGSWRVMRNFASVTVTARFGLAGSVL